MDIKYKVFPSKTKRIEVFGDVDTYEKPMKTIGGRRFGKNGWTIPSQDEERLKTLIRTLGGNPEKQCERVSDKYIAPVSTFSPEKSKPIPEAPKSKPIPEVSIPEAPKSKPVISNPITSKAVQSKRKEEVKSESESESESENESESESEIERQETQSKVGKNRDRDSDSNSESNIESESDIESESESKSPPKKTYKESESSKMQSSKIQSRKSFHSPMYEKGRSKVSNSPMSRKNLDEKGRSKVSNSPMSRKNLEEKGRSKVSNSPMSRKNLEEKGRSKGKKSPGDSEYVVRNIDKITYYKNLSKKGHIDMDDSSTEYTESSDDFPSPSPIKKKYDKNDKNDEIMRMQKRIKELERRR